MCNGADDLMDWCTSYTIDGLVVPDRWFEVLAAGDTVPIAAYLLSAGAPLLLEETDLRAKFMATVESERVCRADASIPIQNVVLQSVRESAWVLSADGKRRRPSEIMLSGQGVRVLKGVYARHGIDLRDPLVANHGGPAAVEALLVRLGAAASLETLGGGSLYDLLMALPERDPGGRVAPGIYRTLIEASVSVDGTPQRELFASDGKMWGWYRGREGYLPVSQLRYNANLTVTKPIEAHIALVSIPRRMNTALVKELFGIAALTSEEIKLELMSEGTEYDVGSEDANEHLRSALPYIYALRLARNLDERGREQALLRRAVLRVCKSAQIAATLPGGGTERIVLAEPGERIVVDTTLVFVGEYRLGGERALTFWLGVAEVVAELMGREVADEVGGVLRCASPAEMMEVLRVRLGQDADDKLAEARSRLVEVAEEVEGVDPPVYALPPPREGGVGPTPPTTAVEQTVSLAGGEGGEGSAEALSEADGSSTSRSFRHVEGPAKKSAKRRRLVVVGPGGGGGGGGGPVATEQVTFRVVEAFEESEGRYVVPVSHLRGADGFGCDLLSVASAEVRDAAIAAATISEAAILRRIEVKGRSTRAGEVELEDNEYRAAQRWRDRYWLYRVYVDPSRESHYEVAVLSDPLGSNAVRTVTRFNLAQGSGATWYKMVETTDDSHIGQDNVGVGKPEPEPEPDPESDAGSGA